MSSSSRSPLWNDGLKLISYCPLCETRYNPMQARVLGEDGETHLFHVTCRTCQTSILAVVLQNASGVSSVGLVTDLTFEDVLQFQNNANVSVDDVIAAHAFFEGDAWKSLYKEPVRTRVHKRPVSKEKKSVKTPKTK